MQEQPEPLVTMERVNKVFYTDEVETRALAEVDLVIFKGEYVSIEGPSGSGKSTLLSILGLLDAPTSGRHVFCGASVADLPGSRRALLRNQQIGYVFQSFNLLGDLTVAENVELPLVYRRMDLAQRKQRTEAALARVGLSHRARHMPSQLSGGQQQRVAVARATAGNPVILFADEPTGNLDSKSGDAVMELLRDMNRAGTTICMVTHNPDYAKHATRNIKLFDGRIVDDAGNSRATYRRTAQA